MFDLGKDLDAAQRRRAAAAFVLMTASLAVGILIGRLSASILPSEPPRTAAAANSGQTSQPPKPLAAAAPAAQPAAPVVQTPATQPAAPQPPKLTITKDLALAESAAPPPNMQVVSAAIGEASPADAGSTDASGTASGEGKVSVINPGARETTRGSGDANASSDRSRDSSGDRSGARSEKVATNAERWESRPMSRGAEECERRYSSFTPQDGTYQPYGGGPRVRCPHLR